MKKCILIGASLLVAVILYTGRSAKAEQREESRHRKVLILWSYQSSTNNGSFVQYTGSKIYCSSSSDGAPILPQGSPQHYFPLVETAQGLAEALDAGYTIKHISDNGQMIILIKAELHSGQ